MATVRVTSRRALHRRSAGGVSWRLVRGCSSSGQRELSSPFDGSGAVCECVGCAHRLLRAVVYVLWLAAADTVTGDKTSSPSSGGVGGDGLRGASLAPDEMWSRRICRTASQRLSPRWRGLGRSDESSTRRSSSSGRWRCRSFSSYVHGSRLGPTRAARAKAPPTRLRAGATATRRASRTCTRRRETARRSASVGTTGWASAQTWLQASCVRQAGCMSARSASATGTGRRSARRRTRFSGHSRWRSGRRGRLTFWPECRRGLHRGRGAVARGEVQLTGGQASGGQRAGTAAGQSRPLRQRFGAAAARSVVVKGSQLDGGAGLRTRFGRRPGTWQSAPK